MTRLTEETDKDVMKRIMSEPTMQAVAEAMRRERKKREKGVVDALRSAGRAALKEGRDE